MGLRTETWLLDPALSSSLHQHIPSRLTFLGSRYNARHSGDGNLSDCPSSSHLPQPIPQAFLGNPSPTLAIWLSLPGTSHWSSRPLDTRPLCLQGSWVLVVGVFPAAPLACCKMLLKFSPRSWSPHGPIRGILVLSCLYSLKLKLWVLVLKL